MQPKSHISPGLLKGQIDFGIIAIREDEFNSILRRLKPKQHAKGARHYAVGAIPTVNGGTYWYAAVRCPEQGPGVAQDVARDLIDDLDPARLLLVGICGALPSSDFTLGDVVCATRVQDLSVRAALEGKPDEYDIMGGPMHRSVQDVFAALQVHQSELKGWNTRKSIGLTKPLVSIARPETNSYYGNARWRHAVHDSLVHHFPPGRVNRSPLVTARSTASSPTLVKSAQLAKQWQKAARSIAAIEMELAGVYIAARRSAHEYPILAIRGISDIVGLHREEAWTAYACNTAAAFAFQLLRSGLLVNPRHRVSSAANPNVICFGEEKLARYGGESADCRKTAQPKNPVDEAITVPPNTEGDGEPVAPANPRDAAVGLVTAQDTQYVELRISKPYSQFSKRDLSRIKKLLRDACDITDPKVINIRSGSTVVTLALPPHEAERLIWAVKRGELDSCGVIDAEFVSDVDSSKATEELLAEFKKVARKNIRLHEVTENIDRLLGKVGIQNPIGLGHTRSPKRKRRVPPEPETLSPKGKPEHLTELAKIIGQQMGARVELQPGRRKGAGRIVIQETTSSHADFIRESLKDLEKKPAVKWLVTKIRGKATDMISIVIEFHSLDEFDAILDALDVKSG